MSGLALSMVLRNPLAARALRVAGPGGMAVGAMLSVYEVGGWRLVLGLPLGVAGVYTGVHYADGVLEEQFRVEVMSKLGELDEGAPPEFVEALRSARGTEFETNRLRLDMEWRPTGTARPQWRLEAIGTRPGALRGWSPALIRVSRAAASEDALKVTDKQPPPQTRFWDSQSGGPVRWQTVWEQAA